MPTTQTTTTTVETVQAGDNVIVTKRGTTWSAPVDLKAGYKGDKWVELRTSDGQLIVRAERGTEVTVVREVPTEEELAAKDVAIRAERLERSRTALLEQLQDGLAVTPRKVMEELMASTDRDFNLVDRYNIEKILQAQVAYDFFATVDAFRTEKGMEVERAFAIAVRKYTEGRNDRVFSRSTSIMSNLVEDAEAAFARQFVKGFGFGAALVRREVAALEAEELGDWF